MTECTCQMRTWIDPDGTQRDEHELARGCPTHGWLFRYAEAPSEAEAIEVLRESRLPMSRVVPFVMRGITS